MDRALLAGNSISLDGRHETVRLSVCAIGQELRQVTVRPSQAMSVEVRLAGARDTGREVARARRPIRPGRRGLVRSLLPAPSAAARVCRSQRHSAMAVMGRLRGFPRNAFAHVDGDELHIRFFSWEPGCSRVVRCRMACSSANSQPACWNQNGCKAGTTVLR